MPPLKGTNASKMLVLPAVPPSPSKTGCRERSLRTAKKKEGSLLPPKKTHSPLPKKVELMFVPLQTFCHPQKRAFKRGAWSNPPPEGR